MRKILTSLGMIAFAGAVVVGGTGAFFSDTETSTANVFTAGALDLKVDSVAHINGLVCFQDAWTPEDQVVWNFDTEQNELAVDADVPAAITDYNTNNPANVPQAGEACEGTWALTDLGATHTFFDYGDIKPGDNGENTISLHVDNNDAYMCAVIHNVESDDNGLTEPEEEDGDATGGDGEGELGQELNFFVWEDDGDNIYNPDADGDVLVNGATGEDIAGVYPLYTPGTGVFPGGETSYLGVYWCYGEFNGVGDCDGSPVTNLTQTDSLKADISFYIEQARNNEGFSCDNIDIGEPTTPDDVVVTNDDLATTIDGVLADPTKWLFYNDTNDTIMTPNQFSSTGGVNEIAAFAGSNGAAKMILDDGTESPDYDGEEGDPRYNIATYGFSATALASISSLKYRINDVSASAQTPFLHFNVSYDGTDVWQGRLVQVPTGVIAGTWTEVDALAATWTKTSGDWPVGVVTAVPFSGSTPRTWADILADYPAIAIRTTDSFFGVRVGHPGPIGEESYVDWVEFDGVVHDFQ